MIPSKKVIDAHAQDFNANEELLLPFLTAFVQCPHLLHATLNALYFQSVCSSSFPYPSYQYQAPSTLYCHHTPHCARHARSPARIISYFAAYTYFEALYFIPVMTAQAVVMMTGAPQPISV